MNSGTENENRQRSNGAYFYGGDVPPGSHKQHRQQNNRSRNTEAAGVKVKVQLAGKCNNRRCKHNALGRRNILYICFHNDTFCVYTLCKTENG